MKESQIVSVVEELKSLSASLESLVGNSDSIHHMKQVRASSKLNEYARKLWAVQRHAHSLFRALKSSWDQTCHPCHEALLRLEDRCISQQAGIVTAGTPASLTFTALFQENIPRADLILSWHQTQVSMVGNHQSEILFPPRCVYRPLGHARADTISIVAHQQTNNRLTPQDLYFQ